MELHELLTPATTAVVTMELQRGVCGDLATFAALRDAVDEHEVGAVAARLCDGARRAGARVVHCTFSLRPDRLGSRFDLPLMAAARHDPGYLLAGTPAVELLAGLGPEPTDVVVDRHHGVSPFTGTGLDAMLRAMDVRTIVATGVSLNLGVMGLAIEAVGLGYTVVLPTDAAVGLPAEYGHAVIRNTLAVICRLTHTAEVLDAWS